MVSATSTSTTTTTANPTTTAGVTTSVDTTFGAGCGPDPCPEQCGPGCIPTATCIASEWMCECECVETGTEGDPCMPLPDALQMWADESKNPPVDCGAVGPGNSAAEWQALHDCVIDSTVGIAFTAFWSQPGGDDPYEYGAAGRILGGYQLAWFELSGTNTLVEYSCTALVPTPDCVVDVGQMCLTCEEQAEEAVLCDEP